MAAIRPKSRGSSTIGMKKSVVAITQVPLVDLPDGGVVAGLGADQQLGEGRGAGLAGQQFLAAPRAPACSRSRRRGRGLVSRTAGSAPDAVMRGAPLGKRGGAERRRHAAARSPAAASTSARVVVRPSDSRTAPSAWEGRRRGRREPRRRLAARMAGRAGRGDHPRAAMEQVASGDARGRARSACSADVRSGADQHEAGHPGAQHARGAGRQPRRCAPSRPGARGRAGRRCRARR